MEDKKELLVVALGGNALLDSKIHVSSESPAPEQSPPMGKEPLWGR